MHTILLALAVAAAMPDGREATSVSHVRFADSRIGRVTVAAAARSETVRRLIEAIDATDVIVYVAAGDCDCPRARGCLSFVAAAGGIRYLRASVSLKQIDDELVTQVGHELQHAVEVASDPRVIDERSLASYYAARSASCGSRQCFETAGAKQIEREIRRDLRASHRR